MKLQAKRLNDRKRIPCQGHVGPLFSGRSCRKLATWKIGRECLCGPHANAAAIRIVKDTENLAKLLSDATL